MIEEKEGKVLLCCCFEKRKGKLFLKKVCIEYNSSMIVVIRYKVGR